MTKKHLESISTGVLGRVWLLVGKGPRPNQHQDPPQHMAPHSTCLFSLSHFSRVSVRHPTKQQGLLRQMADPGVPSLPSQRVTVQLLHLRFAESDNTSTASVTRWNASFAPGAPPSLSGCVMSDLTRFALRTVSSSASRGSSSTWYRSCAPSTRATSPVHKARARTRTAQTAVRYERGAHVQQYSHAMSLAHIQNRARRKSRQLRVWRTCGSACPT
eukprot:359151-Chlamydomonas_euryale.AAC.2